MAGLCLLIWAIWAAILAGVVWWITL